MEAERAAGATLWAVSMSVGKLLSWGIVAFWVVMMSLLVRQEVLPALRLGAPASYRTFLGREREPKTVRMGIYAFHRRLGTSVSTVRPQRDGSTLVASRTEISLGFLPAEGARFTPLTTVRSESEAWVSSLYRLQSFSLRVRSALFSIEMRGVVEGEELVLTVWSGGQAQTARVPFDPEMPIGESLGPLWASGKLQVGRQWGINLLDPRDLTLSQALVEVVGEGRRAWQGKVVRTYRLKVTYEGNEFEAEVTGDGELLRQTISWPLRLELIREETGQPADPGPEQLQRKDAEAQR
jgi:hypothetical protein